MRCISSKRSLVRRIFFQPASMSPSGLTRVLIPCSICTWPEAFLVSTMQPRFNAFSIWLLVRPSSRSTKALHHGVGQGHVGSHGSDHAANAGGQLVAVVVVAGGIQGAIDAIVHLLVIEGRGVGCAGVELNALFSATQPIR